MPVDSSGLYQLTLFSDHSGRYLCNTFHYVTSNFDNNNAQELADVFNTQLMQAIADVCHASVNFTLIECINVNSLNPIGTATPSPAAGSLVGAVMPTYTCGGYKYNRADRSTRNVWKRIGPMTEESVNGNTFDANYLVVADILAAALDNDLTLSTNTARPIILRKLTTPMPWTNVTYSLVNSVNFINRVTTQNSRKD